MLIEKKILKPDCIFCYCLNSNWEKYKNAEKLSDDEQQKKIEIIIILIKLINKINRKIENILIFAFFCSNYGCKLNSGKKIKR